jgi:hypothetical protein
VGLGPAAVVRLERALAHEMLPLHDIDGARPPAGGRTRQGRVHGGSRHPVHRTPTSIAEGTRAPGPGARRTHDDPATAGGDGRAAPPSERHAPRRAGSRRRARCRAVDGAVSVAVAPHRTPTSGTRVAPLVSTDHHAPRTTATTRP